MSPSASELLRGDGLQAKFPGWDLLRIEGSDRERYLQSQLTSDIKALAVGESQMTALLDRSGRLRFYGLLCRGEASFDLLVPSAVADEAAQALEANVIADDVSVRVGETPDMRIMLGAEAVRILSSDSRDSVVPVRGWGSQGFVTWGTDPVDLPEVDSLTIEALGALAGLPRWGSEVEAGMLVHETPLIDSAVSFDKGCYLGQETVAKVASGRGAARGLVALELVGPETLDDLDLPARFATNEKSRAGEVLSEIEWDGTRYLLARLARELRVEGRELQCRFNDDLEAAVQVRELPVVRSPEPAEWAQRLTVAAARAFAEDREDEAIERLERAVAIDPACADAYESLGVIYGRHGEYERAIELMERLLEVDPSSVMAHTNLSLYHNQLGRIEDAEREAALAMRAQMQRENEERDRAAAAEREAEEAAADRERRAGLFRQVLDLDPDDALANFGLGELCVEEGEFDRAVDHLQRALAADPKHSAAIYALGRAHEGAGRQDEARSTYRGGIDIAASRGDLKTAALMRERLVTLDDQSG